MNASIGGSKLDRYGDIWSGFFAQKVINHLNGRVAVGQPVTNHLRNKHNLLDDLRQELWGMILTNQLAPILESIELTASTYDAAYLELAKKLEDRVTSNGEFNDEAKSYFRTVTSAMRIWVDVCREIMN